MKKTILYAILIFATYTILRIMLIPVVFSWTSYGGSENLTFAQELILGVFGFPSSILGIKGMSSIFMNGLFWSLFFVFARYLYTRMIKSRKTAH